MNQPQAANQNSRGKLLLAIGLGCVLVVVLLTQYWPQGEPVAETTLDVARPPVTTPADPAPPRKPAVAPSVATKPEAEAKPQPPSELQPLPEVDLESLRLSNPFLPLGADPTAAQAAAASWRPLGAGSGPASAPADEASQLQEQVSDLQAIVHGRQSGVMIDGRFIQEQDLLNERWRVVSIRPDSIVVEPVSPAESR